MSVLKRVMLAGFAVMLAFATPAFASTGGTPEEAKAMAEKAAALVAEKGEAAFEAIKTGPEFHDKDLYVFVYNPEGTCLAIGSKPELIGKNLIALRDPKGFEFIKAIVSTKEPHWIDYSWHNPATNMVNDKSSYVINVQDKYFVGVGIYK